MTKQRKVHVKVSFDLPEGASKEDALSYVIDAVGSLHGSYRPPGGYGDTDPGDPMFYLDSDSVTAVLVRP